MPLELVWGQLLNDLYPMRWFLICHAGKLRLDHPRSPIHPLPSLMIPRLVQRPTRCSVLATSHVTHSDGSQKADLILFYFLPLKCHQCRLPPRPLGCRKNSSTASLTSSETTLVRFARVRSFRNRGSTVVGSTSSRPCIYRRVFSGSGYSAFQLTPLRLWAHTTTPDHCPSNPLPRRHHSASQKHSSATSLPSLKSRSSPSGAVSGKNGRTGSRIAH